MPHARMVGERLRDHRLRRAAVAAPRAAELDHRRALELVDFSARGLSVGIRDIHFFERVYSVQTSSEPIQLCSTSLPSRKVSVRSQRAGATGRSWPMGTLTPTPTPPPRLPPKPPTPIEGPVRYVGPASESHVCTSA